LNLYIITQVEAVAPQHYRVSVTLEPEHPVFEGHFPGNPVMPGVCTLQMVIDCAGKILGYPVFLSHAPVIKFLGIIHPLNDRNLMIDMMIDSVDMMVKASVTSGERPVMSCKMKMKMKK